VSVRLWRLDIVSIDDGKEGCVNGSQTNWKHRVCLIQSQTCPLRRVNHLCPCSRFQRNQICYDHNLSPMLVCLAFAGANRLNCKSTRLVQRQCTLYFRIESRLSIQQSAPVQMTVDRRYCLSLKNLRDRGLAIQRPKAISTGHRTNPTRRLLVFQ
jgi:hypothetical protein